MGHRRRSATRRLRRRQRGGGRFDRLPLAANAAIPADMEALSQQSDAAITAMKDEILELKTALSDTYTNPAAASDPGIAKKQSAISVRIMELEAAMSHIRFTFLAAYIPVFEQVRQELEANWEFLMTIGHGVLIPGAGVPVPPNTYVIFNAPSGCIATAFGSFPLSERTLGKGASQAASKQTFLREVAVDHLLRQGLLETFTPDTRAALLAGDVYKAEFFSNNKNAQRKTTLSKHLKGLERKRTIYGPDEPVPNMTLTYINNLAEQLILGTYELPIPTAFQQRIHEQQYKALSDAILTAKAAASQSPKDAERIWKNAHDTIKRIDAETFGPGNPHGLNLTPNFIGHKKTIAEVFAGLPPVPAGKQRLIFIPACRGLDKTLTNANYANVARRARRASVAAGLPGGPGANTMAAYEGAYQAAYNLKNPKLARDPAAVAAEAAALEDSQAIKLRKMVKHLLGTENHADLARATARNTGFQKLARTEAARQRGAVPGGAPPPGTNAAFAGAAPEFALPEPVAAAAGGEEAGAEEAAEAPEAGEGGAAGGPEGNARRTRRLRRNRRM